LKKNRSTYFLPLIFLVLLGSTLNAHAQKDLKKAESAYEKGEYCKAISHFSRHLNAYVDKNALVKRGRSYYHCNQLDEALEDFKDALILSYKKDDIEYYMAQCYQQKHEFESAIFHYKNYLASNLKNDFIRKRISDEIKRCAQGINLQYSRSSAFVENLGSALNTEGNEINMIESPLNHNRFYYSQSKIDSLSNYHIKIYNSLETDENKQLFLNPNHKFYNEVINAISEDGQKLYFSRYDEKAKKNTLLVDRFVEGDEPLSNLNIFEGPIKYEEGDRDFFLVNDSLFLFSSNRLKGYGGYDIYLTGIKEGYWFEPINLGKSVNTPFDEITPAMDPGLSVLYFSSDNTHSVGGFDIFSCRYSIDKNNWGEAENIGFPFNSAADDFNFKPLSNGKGALLTSDRKSDGYGGFDVYQVISTEKLFPLDNQHLFAFLNAQEITKAYRKFGIQEKIIAPTPTDTFAYEIVDKLDEGENAFEEELDKISEQETSLNQEDNSSVRSQKILFVKSLYFDAAAPILSNKDQKEYILSVIEILLKNPGLKVKMTGHVSPRHSRWDDQQESLEMLLPLVKLMVDEGVAPDHIFIAGAGSTLGVAKTNVSDRLESASMRYNNRVEFRLFGDDRITVRQEQPFVVQHLRKDDWYLYSSVEKGLSYKISVEITQAEEFEKLLQQLEFCVVDMDIFTTEKEYCFGIFTQFKKARRAARSIQNLSGANVKVLPFIHGEKIEENRLLEYAKTYTDLVNYLESLQ
jgi:tetratricopeptide (TPR) repeat protein